MSGIIESGKGLLGIETQAEKAAKRAGKVQAEGQEAGIAEQRRQFDITQASFQPFQATGVDALEQQRILLGLGGTDPNTALRTDLQSQIEALQGEISEPQKTPQFKFRGKLLGGVIDKASAAANQQRTTELSGLQTQLSEIPEFTPGTNAEQQQAAFAALDQSPGQQFLRDRAQKNLLRSASAIGGLGGGNVRSALVQQGVGFAQQDLQNQFGRLGQLAGQGLAATTNVGQFGSTAAGNIQQGLIGGSQARASGILGAQQARAGAQEQGDELATAALAFFSDPKLKTNRKIIGTKNGHNIWSWTWNKLAKELGLFGNDKGVMADEVKAKNPEAISTRNGYMTVNYKMIGV